MVPAVGVVGATLVLGERPSLADWLGLALVMAAAATVILPRSGRGGAEAWHRLRGLTMRRGTSPLRRQA
jgi:drug/metabolite transporter (DMT)-like permease